MARVEPGSLMSTGVLVWAETELAITSAKTKASTGMSVLKGNRVGKGVVVISGYTGTNPFRRNPKLKPVLKFNIRQR
jgi:hypothetical protein